MRDDFEWHAKLSRERVPKCDRDTAVAIAIFDCKLRGWRWCHGNSEPQISIGSEFFQHGCNGHSLFQKIRRQMPPSICA